MKALLLVSLCLIGFVAGCGGSFEPASQPPPGSGAAGVSSGAGPDGGVTAATQSAVDSKIVVRSSITLEVPVVRDAYTTILSEVRDLGGYAADGRLTDDSRDAATIQVRVPADRHDDVLASIRGLNGAKVRREDSNAKEVTAEYTDLDSRIRNLQRSEAQYQTLLNRAGSIAEIIQVNAKLDEVRGQIETAQGRLNVLNNSTEFATVSVTMAPPPVSAASSIPGPVKVFEGAVAASTSIVLVLVNAVIAVTVFAAWLVPVSAIGFLAWRHIGRRLKAIANRIMT